MLEKTHVLPSRCKIQGFLSARELVLGDLQHQQESLQLSEHPPDVLGIKNLKQNTSSIFFAVLGDTQHQGDPDPWESVYKAEWEERKAELCVHTDSSLESLFTFEKGGEGL